MDEFIICFKNSTANMEEMKKITENAIRHVSTEYKVRRELGCDVQFGDNYSKIH